MQNGCHSAAQELKDVSCNELETLSVSLYLCQCMAIDQKGLLFLGHGSFWINFIYEIDHNESLVV